MRIIDLIRMGIKNLSRRKARTALTVIGVVIGTLSIVIMISIGIGMNTSFRTQVMELGSLTTVTIQKNAAIFDKDGNYVNSKEQTMDENLVNQIKGIKHVKVVSPVYLKSGVMYSGKYRNDFQLYAMDQQAFAEFGFPALTYGTMPSETDKEVLIVGSDISQNFYNPSSRMYEPKTIDFSKDKINLSFNSWEYQMDPNKKEKKIPWKSFAVMEKSNSEYDWACYIDLDIFMKHYKDYIKLLKPEDRKKAEKAMRNYDQIKINVDNIKNVEKVQEAITELGFASESLNMYLKPMEQTSKMMQLVLGGVGAVAMLVSAITIANTMVMSIYERTKEIGVMKVLGCIIGDIKRLFLFEAAMIGLFGGIIGVIVSYIASYCINKFGAPIFSSIMNNGMYQTEVSKFSIIPIWLPILAAGFAMTVGIISGYYPAKRATKISAIEAMKSE